MSKIVPLSARLEKEGKLHINQHKVMKGKILGGRQEHCDDSYFI